MTTFDPYDRNSWFFGTLTREQANDVLRLEKDKGVFLVRNSTSIAGDLVLSVSEEGKFSHYIINKIDVQGEPKFRIGQNTFRDLPTLLTFYKHHYLDSTPLIRAAKRKLEYVRAKYEFLGNDKEDLPFKKREILTVLSKDEKQWWTAKNQLGQIGQIPVPYVETIDEEEYLNEKNKTNSPELESNNNNNSKAKQEGDPSSLEPCRTSIGSSNSSASLNSQLSNLEAKPAITEPSKKSVPNLNRKLPAKAIVIQQRIPNAYDKKALKLEKGDTILVTDMNINGQWEGELHGKKGHFPFNYIKFLEDENLDAP